MSTKIKDTPAARTFRALLDAEEREEKYQDFLEKNTRFIPRLFLKNHGLHMDLVVRKIGLGRDYVPDFFYLSKSSAEWHCVLIEIEKPQSRFFKDGSNDYHAHFLAAIQQIDYWRAWFDDPVNASSFTNSTIAPMRRPMGENPCRIKYILVHGRRAELSNKQRRSLVRAKERDDFSILTYDSLVDHPSSRPLYVGVRRNDHLDIISDEFISESLFVNIESPGLHISEALRADALKKRAKWRTLSTVAKGDKKFMDMALRDAIISRSDNRTSSQLP